MYCSKCGAENDENAYRCTGCGEELHAGVQSPLIATKQSAKAVWSVVLGILGVVGCWFFAGLPAIVLGILAKSDIRKEQGRLEGDGYATTGIVLGAISLVTPMFLILLAIALPNFLEAQVRARVSKAFGELRSLSIALESYHLDYKTYPETADLETLLQEGPQGPQNFKALVPLTTPTPYLTSVFMDSFSGQDPKPYFYFSADPKEGFILWGVGPDGVSDIQSMADIERAKDRGSDLHYSPTNGTKSPGDIIRMSQ